MKLFRYTLSGIAAALLLAMAVHQAPAKQPGKQANGNNRRTEASKHQNKHQKADEEQSTTSNQSAKDQSDQERTRQQESTARKFLDKYDENEDGILTQDELPRDMRDGFSRLDRNGDDEVTVAELRQHASRMQAKKRAIPVEIIYIWATDADQGRMSRQDLQDAYETLREIDENDDGRISQAELRDRREQNATQWAKTILNRLDDDDDGQLAQDEVEGTFLGRRFDEVDKNSNDLISQRELQQCLLDGRSSESQDRSGQTTAGEEQKDRRF